MDLTEQLRSKLRNRHIELSAPVDIADIRRFEEAHHITLPKDPADFYTRISNGCKMIDDFDLYPFEEWKVLY